MIPYILVIIILFFLSNTRLNKRQTLLFVFLLMLFLCFGYMTGSDWRTYENYYNNGFTFKLVEPGYMLLSNFSAGLGIDFWVYHVFIKCICFLLIIWFVIKLSGNSNIFFPLMLWTASFGFYLLVNCPFRNLIAVGLSVISFYYLLQKKYLLYYVFSLIAITFHMSAMILLLLPIIKLEKISTRALVFIYFLLMIVFGTIGVGAIYSMIGNYLPGIVAERVMYYEEGMEGSILSLGSIPRLVCLMMIMIYRKKIITSFQYGSIVFNFCYTYLVFSLIYYMIPMLFRCALYLAPFYVFGIIYSAQLLVRQKRILYKLGWFALAIFVTITTTKSVYYVPYTNIIVNCVKGEFYDFNYRNNYNFKNSPYVTSTDDINEMDY